MTSILEPDMEETIRLVQHISGAATLPFNCLVLFVIIVDGDSRNKDYRKYICTLQVTAMLIDTLSDAYAPITLFNKGLLYADSYLSNTLSFWHFFEVELVLVVQVPVVYFACVYYRRGSDGRESVGNEETELHWELKTAIVYNQMVLSSGRRFNYFAWKRKVLYALLEASVLATVGIMFHLMRKSIQASEPLLPPELQWVRKRTTFMYMLPDANNIYANCVFFPVMIAILSAIIAMVVQIKAEVKRGMQWSSKATLRYQRLAVRSLILQGTVPTLVYAIPSCTMGNLQFAQIFLDLGKDFDRAASLLSPILYIIMTRHAFVNSLTILYCSPSYRRKILAVVTNSHDSVPTKVVEITKINVTQ